MQGVPERWVPATEIDKLRDGRAVVRVEDRQIALFQVGDRFYAVDNRCPHMGYPLAAGGLRGETLTCDWHNWKFNLAGGGCLRGEEDVRAYDVRVDGGRLLVNIVPEPVEQLMAKHLASLRAGLVRHERGRIARDAARLLALGMTPAQVMREGALHNAEREEYGWGHALAVIADCAGMGEFYATSAGDRLDPPERWVNEPVKFAAGDGAAARWAAIGDGGDIAIPVLRALLAAAEPVSRYPTRPTPEAEPPDQRGEQEFRRRIEEEDVDGAEAWLRGALEGGIADRELSRWLINAASDHFLGFGHQMIYVYKATQMAEAFGWQAMRGVLPAIVPSIAWATRYDRLPEMRRYIKRLHEIEATLPAIADKQRRPVTTWDSARFRGQVLFGRGDAAFEAIHGALAAGVQVDLVARELVLAASERMLRMDIEWELSREEKVWDEGGWLEVTHLLTHANATRHLLRRGVTAESLRSLYHNAWFINWQRRFDRADGIRAGDGTLPQPAATDPDELAGDYRAALRGHRIEEALGIVRRWGQLELPSEELLRALGREAMEVDDGEFIMMAHVLKTARAAIQEHRTLGGHPEATLPLLAATRYVASPRRQVAVYDLALNGVKFVSSGAARSI